MKGTVHPRRLLLCLVLVPALLAGLGAWQSWRAEQQAERLGAAQQRVERALAERGRCRRGASVRVDGRAYVRDLALARLDEQLADTRSAQRLNRFAAVLADSGACLAALVAVLGAVSLAGIAGAARSALRSRRCLLLWFELGRRLLPCLLLAQIGLLALALACAGTFEILGLWRVGQVPVSEDAPERGADPSRPAGVGVANAGEDQPLAPAPGAGPGCHRPPAGRRGCTGTLDATARAGGAPRHASPAPVGRSLRRLLRDRQPRLPATFRRASGRTQPIPPLPLLGLLDRAELSAVIAHELAHFAGRDAHYSLHFLPIYQGAASQLAAIEQEANVFERAALEPARLLAGYFLERFGLAVNHWSRLREFAADRRAAQLAGAPAMASAPAAQRGDRRADTGVPRTLPARSGARAGPWWTPSTSTWASPAWKHRPRGGTPGPSAGYPPSAGPALHGAGRELPNAPGPGPPAGPFRRPPSQALGVWFGAPGEPSAQRRPARQDL